jgi:hypothetical protein
MPPKSRCDDSDDGISDCQLSVDKGKVSVAETGATDQTKAKSESAYTLIPEEILSNLQYTLYDEFDGSTEDPAASDQVAYHEARRHRGYIPCLRKLHLSSHCPGRRYNPDGLDGDLPGADAQLEVDKQPNLSLAQKRSQIHWTRNSSRYCIPTMSGDYSTRPARLTSHDSFR